MSARTRSGSQAGTSSGKRGRRSKFVCALDELVSTPRSKDSIDNYSSDRATGVSFKRPRTCEVDGDHTSNLESLVMELGLCTFLLTYQACSHVPQCALHYRNDWIVNIILAAEIDIPREKLLTVIKSIDNTKGPKCKELLTIGPPPIEALWKATHDSGVSHLRFLVPPTISCLNCHSLLGSNNKPTQVILYTQSGPVPATKIILRCTHCNINYHPDVFGNLTDGYGFYDEFQPVVKCTQEAYMERQVHSMIVSAGHHAWTSFESWAEIYNEVHNNSSNSLETKKFFTKQPQYIQEKDEDDEQFVSHLTEKLTRKHVSESFWNGEVENELRDVNEDFKFTTKLDREEFMNYVDQQRSKNSYVHKDCSEECRKRGCGTLWSIDGNWKLTYPICAYEEPKNIFTGKLKYVSSCPKQPVPKMAFCKEHCEMAQKQDIPIELKAYVKYRKEQGQANRFSSCDSSVANDTLTAADCQGISKVINEHPQFPTVIDYTDEDNSTKTTCNKDTGSQKRSQKWTRGHLFIVRGGGHIDSWQPLYQSEGPAQVFLIVLTWMISAFSSLRREDVKKKILSYDNMCHLNNLKVAKQPLPLPVELRYIWLDVQKIIDSLHISNHKDPRCKQLYNPEDVKQKYPDCNTMCCEQTFAWLSRYKKILTSMPKTHHHFYLHRMVKRRNQYIEDCYKSGRRPVLPGVKMTVKTKITD